MSAAPLESSELATLLFRLEQAVQETSGRFVVQMTLVAALFGALGAGMAVAGSWIVAVVVWAFGVFLGYMGYRAGKKTAPAQMQPVVDAVREAPDQIVLVRHYETSDSARMFVTHWLEIKTATHRLIIKAPDWEQLNQFLRRRCPAAEFTS